MISGIVRETPFQTHFLLLRPRMGVSIESEDFLSRIDHLRQCNAQIRFLSLEPLLGPLPKLDLKEIDWVIAGGESGPNARSVEVEWVREIRDQCLAAGVPHFFKQWGRLSNNPDETDPTAKENGGRAKGGRLLDGRTWDEMPPIESQSPAPSNGKESPFVVHCRRAKCDVYVGRPSKWGNPFKIGLDGTREEVIHKYRTWLLEERPDLVAAAKEELKDKILGCWCAPKPCHGDVLSEIANRE
ncbi:MAG: DUF5131 family protein [Candidatus Omnitrophica bacterium]|nr:DUF5131 family protein [Candidatus Omnitrophota bacterium]